jgi:hypothetical protein
VHEFARTRPVTRTPGIAHHPLRMAVACLGVAGVAGVAAVLGVTVTGRHRDAGCTGAERSSRLPGDELLPSAALSATRAISIAASPEDVWPWVAQLGQERGGFYSYAPLENAVGCRITNAEAIVEAWQHPTEGDPFHLHPKAPLVIALVEPGRALVASSSPMPPPAGGVGFTWAFVVEPDGGGGSRLLIRERYAYQGAAMRAVIEITSWASLIMTLGTLRGIRARAEG